MKIKPKRALGVKLSVNDNFANLLSIDDVGAFIYEFRFFCNSLEAVRQSLNTVRITIRKSLPAVNQDVFLPINENNDTRSFLKDVLVVDSKEKDVRRSAKADVITAINVDLTSTINNEIANVIGKKDILDRKKSIALIEVAELKKKNVNVPILLSSVDEQRTISVGKAKSIANDLLSKGIDPTVVGIPSKRLQGAYSAFSSLHAQGSRADYNSRVEELKSAYQVRAPVSASSLSDSTFIPVIIDADLKEKLNVKTVRVPASVGYDDFYVTFELLDSAGVVRDNITKKIPHNLLLRVFNTPRTPPYAAIAPSQFSGKNVIEIQQNDERAVAVRILRRRIDKSSVSNNNSRYELVNEISLKKVDGLSKFIDVVNNSSTILYRCISVGPGGILGSEFTNAIAMPVQQKTSLRYQRSFAAALNVKTVTNGLAITVTTVPHGVVAIAVLKRDKSIFEKDYTFVDDFEPVRAVNSGMSNLTFLDRAVKNGHVYEYRCRAYYDDGTELMTTAYAFKTYTPLSAGAVNVNVTNLQVTRDGIPDIKFDVASVITNEGLTQVQKLLEKQGLTDLYSSELETERASLQKLIAHHITRIDITTGLEESFGTFTGTTFSDSLEGSKVGVSKLKEGHKYRYVISTLARDPETMFEEFKKQVVDKVTGRSYSFKPSISRHPLSLARGTLITQETVKSLHPEDDFFHGHLGNSHEIDVTIDVSTPKILNASAKRIDRKTTSIQWTLEGSAHKIEHFIVAKELLGQIVIVGKTHNVSEGKNYEFFDSITPDDIGEISYRITPVLNDYSQGATMISNKLRIVDARSANVS